MIQVPKHKVNQVGNIGHEDVKQEAYQMPKFVLWIFYSSRPDHPSKPKFVITIF